MGLPNIGPLELIIILAVLLLIVGPRRLPEMGQAVGRTIREFRKASTEITDATTVSSEPPAVPPAIPVPPAVASPPPPSTTPPGPAAAPVPGSEPSAVEALTTPISPTDSQAPAPAGTDGTPDASRPS